MRLLLVEDDVMVASGIKLGLSDAGYAVDWVGSAERALEVLAQEAFDVAVIDIGLPGINGLELTRRLRGSDVESKAMPVLILTARSAWQEKVAGIDAGADDYLAKPFHMEELLARLRALLRRGGEHASAEWQCGSITLDTRQARVLVAGQALSLTSHEFKLLAQLMQRKGQVLSRTELSEHLYAFDSDRDSNTIEVFVGRLRKKLPSGSIETVRGLGYRLVDPGAVAP